MMIIFSTINFIPYEYLQVKGIKTIFKYNLFSYINEGIKLQAILPPIELNFGQNYDPMSIVQKDDVDRTSDAFDYAYHTYIINDNNAFIEFMDIITKARDNPDAVIQILIEDSEYRMNIVESIIKLIQRRYGYNAYIVKEPLDFLYTDEPDFSIPGLFTLDEDTIRFQSLVCSPNDLREDEYD